MKTLLVVLLFINSFINAQVEVPVFGKISYLKGYTKEVTGQNINYFSALPEVAKTALLTRCQTGEQAIEWETESVPPTFTGKYIYFAWLAAHSKATSHGDRNFDLFINNKKALTITTFEKKNFSSWSFSGDKGEKLVFEWKTDDGAGDAHGFMYLRVPITMVKKGEALRLKIVGKKEESPDWMMTFKYELAEKVNIYPVSLLTHDNKQPLQIIAVHFGKDTTLSVTSSAGKENLFELKTGMNTFEILHDAVTEPKMLDFDFSIPGKLKERQSVNLKPVSKRQIYLIHHSHYDVGYSHIQEEVIDIHNNNISSSLRYIEKTKDYPEDARYKWNIETTLAIENFLKICTAEQKEKLIQGIKGGSIGIGGLYANIMTGICQPEELFKLNMFARQLEKEWGVRIPAVMIGDIPGVTWGTIPALAWSGVKYFSNGPNYMGSFPYGGDRVGHSFNNWADRPFWWVSPSGNEKILFWMAGKGYSSWHGFKPGDINSYRGKKKISEYMNELDEASFPYSMVQWRYNIGADNGSADSLVSDFVRDWNQKYSSPHIVLSTIENMFEEFEKRYGDILPAYSGDLTPYWEDGAYSSAYEMGMNRINSEKLTALSTINVIINPEGFPDQKFDRAWKSTLLWDEHTWGAHNSISEPDNPFVSHQWKYKQQFALATDSLVKVIEKSFEIPDPSGNIIDVYNPASWERTDIVYVKAQMAGDMNSVSDENNNPVISQKLSDGRIAFLASKVPPLGAKRFLLFKNDKEKPGVSSRINFLENESIALALDDNTGSIKSIQYKPKQTELVNTKLHSGINEYLYVPGRDPLKAVTNEKPVFKIKESGSLFTTITVESNAMGCNKLVREISLVNYLNRIEIKNIIDKKPIREKESVHFAFPYAITDGVTRFNTGWGGIFQPGVNQLPGSNQDYYSTQHWCDVSNQDVGFSLLVKEACLIEPGALLNEIPGKFGSKIWKTKADSQSVIYSYVMNNYWHTNYKADQEGPVIFNYAILPHKLFNQTVLEKAGIEFNQPMLVLPASENHQISSSLFAISNPNILATSITPENNKIRIRLFNAGSAPEQFNIHWSVLKPLKIKLYNRYDDFVEIKPNEIIRLSAHAIAEVEVER